MKTKLFQPLELKFEDADWANNPEFGLFDTILESHPELLKIIAPDIMRGQKPGQFGRGDTPTAEQIMRAAIYREMKNIDYRQLQYAQKDSRICEKFVKINPQRPYSFQMYQKYISKIQEPTLKKLMVALNKIAIEEGLEDLQKFRQDSTVVETNIHYPTNNSIIRDCIKESHRLLNRLEQEIHNFTCEDYLSQGKKTYFKINVTKSADERVVLFQQQLARFAACINQVSNIVKKKRKYPANPVVLGCISALEELLGLMGQVYQMSYRKEILGEQVPADSKIFSIYELHTDIIVKGSRQVQFGHKVNLGSGKSNLILSCEIVKGNPKDSDLYQGTIQTVIKDYGKAPVSSVADGGFASLKNLAYARKAGIANIVFNKVVGSLRNIASSKSMEKRLKRWRSGIEAVISNLKRGFHIARCVWKGQEHFNQKVLWSVIGYNIRVMTGAVLKALFA
jgi:IS5 family transposase